MYSSVCIRRSLSIRAKRDAWWVRTGWVAEDGEMRKRASCLPSSEALPKPELGEFCHSTFFPLLCQWICPLFSAVASYPAANYTAFALIVCILPTLLCLFILSRSHPYGLEGMIRWELLLLEISIACLGLWHTSLNAPTVRILALVLHEYLRNGMHNTDSEESKVIARVSYSIVNHISLSIASFVGCPTSGEWDTKHVHEHSTIQAHAR